MKITSASFVKGIVSEDPIITEPIPQFAFIGRSNVGKSSLMNCLLNSKSLVKTGDTPGKTTEINFFRINNNLFFVDLPGYGFSKAKQIKREQVADIIQWYFFEPVFKRKTILVIDARIKPSDFDQEMYRLLQSSRNETIIAANKIDTLNQKELNTNLEALNKAFPHTKIIPCSAKTKVGREELWKRMLE
ncbi:MAG: ribosome biogenesis GTP-binding protein YihA/YsxC [bacterium]